MTPTSRIQQEIRQSRPFRSASQEGVVALMRTADMLRRHFEGVVAPGGITHPQYNVLRILRGAGPGGLPTLEVAERLIEQAPGITRMMDRLEAKGLVRRARDPDDRRQVRCYLTAAGSRVLKALDGPMDRADDQPMRGLSESDRRKLIRLLDRVREALDEGGQP